MHYNLTESNIFDPNDYSDEYSFFLQDIDIEVFTSIDKILLSANINYKFKFFNAIEAFAKPMSDFQLQKGNYNRKRLFSLDDNKFDIVYNPKFNAHYLPSALITLHQPTRQLMHYLSDVFKRLHIFIVISQIGLVWDFYNPCPWLFCPFLANHVFLKNNRGVGKKCEATFYTNDLRKSTKGIRIYSRPKNKNCQNCSRLELVLNRAPIKKYGIRFPLKARHLDIDFKNFFEFRRINWEQVLEYSISENKKAIFIQNQGKHRNGDLLRCQIESYISTLSCMPLTNSVSILKDGGYGIDEYSRFFEPMGMMNLIIEQTAHEQRFGLLS